MRTGTPFNNGEETANQKLPQNHLSKTTPPKMHILVIKVYYPYVIRNISTHFVAALFGDCDKCFGEEDLTENNSPVLLLYGTIFMQI